MRVRERNTKKRPDRTTTRTDTGRTHQIPAVGGKGIAPVVSPYRRGRGAVVALDAKHAQVVHGGDPEGFEGLVGSVIGGADDDGGGRFLLLLLVVVSHHLKVERGLVLDLVGTALLEITTGQDHGDSQEGSQEDPQEGLPAGLAPVNDFQGLFPLLRGSPREQGGLLVGRVLETGHGRRGGRRRRDRSVPVVVVGVVVVGPRRQRDDRSDGRDPGNGGVGGGGGGNHDLFFLHEVLRRWIRWRRLFLIRFNSQFDPVGLSSEVRRRNVFVGSIPNGVVLILCSRFVCVLVDRRFRHQFQL